MFKDDFVWGIADSAYQIEGRAEDDGCGRITWDNFCEHGGVWGGHVAGQAADHIHRYKEDFALMKNLGIKHYRFSVNWARILPNGVGEVNQKGIDFYVDVLKELKKNGITPYFTMFHWEFPEELQKRGGWMNPDSVQWFGEYAKVVAENFSEYCEYFITLNEPQCFVGSGHLKGEHAPGLKMTLKDTFLITHNALKAHGQACINLRKYAKRPIKVGYAPTCSVALPATNSPEDIEAARETYFSLRNPLRDWGWNVAWFSDPVFLGKYPEEGLKKFGPYLPEITEEDMELIHQPLDFMGQNVYNGYYVRRAEDGSIQDVDRYLGAPKTALQWVVTPECLYWGCKFLYDRYHLPIYITENGMACHDVLAVDGKIHDKDRIDFLERYLHAMQCAADEGADVRGFFLWTFLDNFEWSSGYNDRFGIIHVDFRTQKRTVKESAYWYQKVIESNGRSLALNNVPKELFSLKPETKELVWGTESWDVSANSGADSEILDGRYMGMTLTNVYKEHPEVFGNVNYEEFPLLVKTIEAKEDSSIQVHPDDAFAKANEGVTCGKTETWYILDCPENAQLVLGYNAKDKAEAKKIVEAGNFDGLVKKVAIKKGDVLTIKPGTLHAVTAGVKLLEIQQNCDVTYRVFDYNREVNGVKRELHVDKSMAVLAENGEAPAITNASDTAKNTVVEVAKNDKFTVAKVTVEGKTNVEVDAPFVLLNVVEGYGIIEDKSAQAGDAFLVPAGYGALTMIGNMDVIVSYVNA